MEAPVVAQSALAKRLTKISQSNPTGTECVLPVAVLLLYKVENE